MRTILGRPELPLIIALCDHNDQVACGGKMDAITRDYQHCELSMAEEAYHFSPDLMELLIDTIPLLCRSKAVAAVEQGVKTLDPAAAPAVSRLAAQVENAASDVAKDVAAGVAAAPAVTPVEAAPMVG